MLNRQQVNAYLKNATISGNAELDKQLKEELARQYWSSVEDLEHACLELTTNVEHRQLLQAWTKVFKKAHTTSDQRTQLFVNALVSTGMTPVAAAILVVKIMEVKVTEGDKASVNREWEQAIPFEGGMSPFEAFVHIQNALAPEVIETETADTNN